MNVRKKFAIKSWTEVDSKYYKKSSRKRWDHYVRMILPLIESALKSGPKKTDPPKKDFAEPPGETICPERGMAGLTPLGDLTSSGRYSGREENLLLKSTCSKTLSMSSFSLLKKLSLGRSSFESTCDWRRLKGAMPSCAGVGASTNFGES